MWLVDLRRAIGELIDIYGMECCVLRIEDNFVTMTNGDRWDIDRDGHIHKLREKN